MLTRLRTYASFVRISHTVFALPFALVGSVWLMRLMAFDISVATTVGFIALAGVAAETGVVMLIYLQHALDEAAERCRAAGRTRAARSPGTERRPPRRSIRRCP